MRSSVTRHTKRLTRTRRRLYIALILTVLAVACGAFIMYANWRVDTDIRERAVAQQKLFAKIDAQVTATKKKRIDDAKKAEAAATANAAEFETKRKAEAAANPSGTASTAPASCGVSDPTSIKVVVNKKHCFDPLTWEPGDLTAVAGVYMRAEATEHMQSMMDAATAAGQGFLISSAYRSYYNQVSTYNYWVSANGSQAEADKVSARPGYSEHQTGLAADLKAGSCTLDCFGGTTQYQWIAEHAAEYGFIRRYPEGMTSITGYEPESWHWRYVGVAAVQDMKSKGIKTLEQYFSITGGDY